MRFWFKKKPVVEKPHMPIGKSKRSQDRIMRSAYSYIPAPGIPKRKIPPALQVQGDTHTDVEFRYTKEHGLQQFNNGVMVGTGGVPFDPEKHKPIVNSFSIKRKKRFWIF